MTPAPPSADDLRRLHFINALFAQVTRHDLYLAQQIKEGIAFSLAELEGHAEGHPEIAGKFDAAFNAAAARLIEKFCIPRTSGFFHWDAARSAHAATPLFARAELVEGLKLLAPYREATLLVSNLRPALLPPQRRASARRRREYADALAYIRELAASRATRHANLQLLFL